VAPAAQEPHGGRERRVAAAHCDRDDRGAVDPGLADPDVQNLELGASPPSWQHPCGTDLLGRDLLARVVHGGRVSMLVGLVATLVSFLVGVSYGAIAGYFGGRTDDLMMRFVDVLYSLPYMFLVILLMVYSAAACGCCSRRWDSCSG
jgi:oligopeptide transport system permease protein